MIWRVFLKDVLECARCAGRMEIVAVVTSKGSVTRILDYMGLPVTAPIIHPSRPPPQTICPSKSAGLNGSTVEASQAPDAIYIVLHIRQCPPDPSADPALKSPAPRRVEVGRLAERGSPREVPLGIISSLLRLTRHW